jgi:hypothetical protein
MKIQISLVLALLMNSFGANGFADDQTKPFSYRVEVPAATADCSGHAVSVADLFASATGAQVDGSTCTERTFTDNGATFTNHVIIVNYHATQELVPYRAVLGGSAEFSVSNDGESLFDKYADCVKALPEQVQNFNSFSGIPEVAAYCQNPSVAEATGYVMVVEGFGSPTSRLYAFQRDNLVNSATALPDAMAAVTSIIQTSGGNISYSDNARILYWAASPVGVNWAEPVYSFDSTADCQSQLADAQSIYVNAGSKQVQSFCEPFGDDSTYNGQLVVIAAGYGDVDNDFGYSSAQYADLASCNADKARVIQNATSNGAQILGALCAPRDASSGFAMSLFTKQP